MRNTKEIEPATAQGFAVMLTPFFPGITGESLVNALLSYEDGESKPEVLERPYTRKEAAEILHISPATVDRLLKSGLLKKICTPGTEGKRGYFMRITAASIRDFLNGRASTATNATTATNEEA